MVDGVFIWVSLYTFWGVVCHFFSLHTFYFRLFLFQPSLHTSLEHFPKFCQSQIENIEVSRAHGLHCFRIVNVFGLPKGTIVQLHVLARCLHNRSKGCCGVAVANITETGRKHLGLALCLKTAAILETQRAWKRSQLFKATLDTL